jgi:CRISPR-associated protein (TIGR03986 family)
MEFPGREEMVRKYEVFVPYPVELDDFYSLTYPCTSACVDRFIALADERYESQTNDRPADPKLLLPLAPIQVRRENGPLRPRSGDLVFFKPSLSKDEKGNETPVIAEISYSSIWRGRLETVEADAAAIDGRRIVPYKTHSALSDKNFLPLGVDSDRTMLSPSELMFGAVELRENESKRAEAQTNPKSSLAFASKVRFGFGESVRATHLLREAATLKILASPKPPSPSMYFEKKNHARMAFIAKDALSKAPSQFQFKGRKMYLHGLRNNNKVVDLDRNGYISHAAARCQPWASVNGMDPSTLKQKVTVTPIDADNDFYFEVDFCNLSRAELESLCASLIPHPSFEHKIGMGKPIGLGSVKLDIMGMYLVDPVARYSVDSFANPSRWHHVWKHADLNESELSAHLQCGQASTKGDLFATPAELAATHMAAFKASSPDAYQALMLIGDPDQVVAPVHYPQVSGQSIEDKTFQWFVKNDKVGTVPKQGLDSLDENSTGLPLLKRLV